jgi:ubiquinone/menaquinone biosynthesis C-methylase UbiE
MDNIKYHLKELEIALDTTNSRRILPDVLKSDQCILDIGCGIGQSLLALDCPDKRRIGIDIDHDSLKYGMDQYGDQIQFIWADAKRIPLPAQSCDLVFSRVTLPYTNVPQTIREIRRVLRAKGRVWMTVHDRTMAQRYLKEAIAQRDLKLLLQKSYMLLNGYLFKYLGFVVPFITGRYESWQDLERISQLLRHHGFDVHIHETDRHRVIEGHLS